MKVMQEKNSTTTLQVDLDSEESWPAEEPDPRVMKEYKVLFGRKRKPHFPLPLLRDLSRTEDLTLQLKSGEELIDVELPPEMVERLSQYLSSDEYPFEKDFDCTSFVHWMIGEPYTYGQGIDFSKFWIRPVESENMLKPGDAVYFFPDFPSVDSDMLNAFIETMPDKVQHFVVSILKRKKSGHAAIYLGNGLFLSKFGLYRIAVQTADQIAGVYGECSILKQVRKTA